MALIWDHAQLRPRDALRELAAESLRQAQVELADRHERRYRDRAHAVVGVVRDQGVGRAAEGVDRLGVRLASAVVSHSSMIPSL